MIHAPRHPTSRECNSRSSAGPFKPQERSLGFWPRHDTGWLRTLSVLFLGLWPRHDSGWLRTLSVLFLGLWPRHDTGWSRALSVLFLGLLLSLPALAVEPSEMLSDPALEARAREISRELRCVVCQNESVDDSPAEVARDIRRAVRERLVAGDTNRQVLDYMVARYGDYVLLKPPFKTRTLVLWLGTPLVLLLGAAGLWLAARRRAAGLTPAPLSEAERARVDALLQPVTSTEAKRGGGASSAPGKVSPRAPSAPGRDGG
ncbi:MAG: cytochrome c-type biogenesis protein CcmH [Proteobacteria bacterium]|nr:cytochrome c-type biogenesis protein CcmH [Pseudomonadota bacterium]